MKEFIGKMELSKFNAISDDASDLSKMKPVTVEEYRQALDGGTNKKGDIGERIVAGLLRALYKEKGEIRHIKEKNIQMQEVDFWRVFTDERGMHIECHEVKFDTGTFAYEGFANKKSDNLKFVLDEISDDRGTGNLFIEMIQNVPSDWIKERTVDGMGRKWKPGKTPRLGSDEMRQLGNGEKIARKGWLEVMYENPGGDAPGASWRYVWFVPYTPYKEGVRQLIIRIPEGQLFDIVEHAEKYNLRPVIKTSNGKHVFGYLLPLKEIFEFEIWDESASEPYSKVDFFRVVIENGKPVIRLGAVSKKTNSAIAYLWDVDKGEDGYTSILTDVLAGRKLCDSSNIAAYMKEQKEFGADSEIYFTRNGIVVTKS